MIITSRRNEWVLVLPVMGLVATVCTGYLLLQSPCSAYDIPLCILFWLFAAMTLHGLRFVNRKGDLLVCWLPEAWSPLRRDILQVVGLSVALEIQGRALELTIKGRRNVTILLAAYVIGYDSPIKANRHRERVCEALRVPIAKKDV